MLKKRTTWLLLVTALILVLALAACGGNKEEATQAASGGEATSAPAQAQPTKQESESTTVPEATPVPPTATAEQPSPTPEPENTPEPAETPTTEPELASNFAKIEDVVDSYRSKGLIAYSISGLPEKEGEEPANVDIKMETTTEWVKADNAFGYNLHTSLKSSQPMGDSQESIDSIEIYMVDNNTYMKLGDQWMTLPRDEDSEMMTFDFSPDDILTGAEDIKKVGTEDVNGIKAVHYQFDNIEDYETLFNGMLNDVVNPDEYTVKLDESQVKGDIWIAKDGQYPVKINWMMTLTFDITEKSSGKTSTATLKSEMSTEIYDVNADITIEVPEEVAGKSGPAVPGFENEPFPVPENTTLQGAFGGMFTYISQLPADQVTQFYNDTLTKMGWSKTGDDMAATWSKGGNQFMLMIAPNDDGTTNITVLAGGS